MPSIGNENNLFKFVTTEIIFIGSTKNYEN